MFAHVYIICAYYVYVPELPCALCVHQFYECVFLCVVEVMSEMAGRHVEAIETWSSSEHGR